MQREGTCFFRAAQCSQSIFPSLVAVIGLGFLLEAYKSFGILGIAAFYAGHIGADFLWYGLISGVVGKTRRFIKENLYRSIIVVLGSLLVFFGGNFLYKALL